MANKQIFAQVGVFALLGLNVGAYYVFWPHKESAAQSETQPVQARGKTLLLPEKKETPTPVMPITPQEIPAQTVSNVVPLQIVNPPSKPPEPSNDDEAIRRLLQSIQKDDPAAKKSDDDFEPPPPVPFRTIDDDQRPSKLPPAEKNVATTSALTPRLAPSPWLLNMEMVGGQTQLIARLKQPVVNQKPALEFKIMCDRV